MRAVRPAGLWRWRPQRRVSSTLLCLVVVGGCASRSVTPLVISPPAGQTPPGASQPVRMLGRDLTRLVGQPDGHRAVWGIVVRSLDHGETLYRLNPRTLLMPASTQKIVTLAVAAEQLGWDYRFTTELLTAGEITEGTLNGDLIVRGSGDPTLNAPAGAENVFASWAASLQDLGIYKVSGRLIGDDRLFDDATGEWTGLGPGWAWDDLALGFATPGGALLQHENVSTLLVTPGLQPGDPATVGIVGPRDVAVENGIVTSPTGSGVSLHIYRPPGGSRLVLEGQLPVDHPQVRRSLAVHDPTAAFLHALSAAFADAGIEIAGGVFDIDQLARPDPLHTGPHMRALVRHHSPPLTEIAREMMQRSQNLYAEMLWHTLGVMAVNDSQSDVADVVATMLYSWQVTPDQFVLADGSGLSRYNYLTAEALVRILERMGNDPRHGHRFQAALATAGRNGTLATRLVGTPAAGRAHAKTGTMLNVRALAGYVETQDGERLAFAIVANNLQHPDAIVTIIDRIVVRLATFSRGRTHGQAAGRSPRRR